MNKQQRHAEYAAHARSMDALEVGHEIQSQLGGRRFSVMTGAKDYVSLVEKRGGIQFRLPNRFAKDGINMVRIVLTDADEYEITFGKFKGLTFNVVKVETGITVDLLHSTFTEATGLDTHL